MRALRKLPLAPAAVYFRGLRASAAAHVKRECRQGSTIHWPPAVDSAGFLVVELREPASTTLVLSQYVLILHFFFPDCILFFLFGVC